MFRRLLALFAFVLAFASPALADSIAVVDFQKALNQVSEAATVKANLEKMTADRKSTLDKMKASYDAAVADYQKQQMLLSDSARQDKEKELYQKGQELQATMGRYEGELQEAQYNAMNKFVEKMKTIAQTIGKEKGYTIVLEVNQGGAVYWSATAPDITDELIKRYNAGK